MRIAIAIVVFAGLLTLTICRLVPGKETQGAVFENETQR
jgi:hypothetical protein